MIRTIKPEAANIRINAGKVIALSPVTVTEDGYNPSVQRLRTNAGKSIATTPSVVTETDYQPRFQAIRKNAGKVIPQRDNYFAVKIPYYTGSHIRNFNPGGFLLEHTNMVSPLTFCIWVKTTLTRRQVLLSFASYFATSTTSFPFQVSINGSGGVGVVLDGGGDFSGDLSFTMAGLNINNGNWHHIGVIYVANSSFKTYVDGAKVDDRSITVTCNNPSGLRWGIGTYSVYNGGRSDALDGYVGDMAYPIFAPSINSESIITDAYSLKP